MQDVYQTVRLMSVQEMVDGAKDYFGWKSRFGTVSGTKRMVSALSMEWMQEACNGTSCDTVELGNENMANVEEEESKSNEDDETSREMSEQAEDGPGYKYYQPDADGHVEVECGGVEAATAEVSETLQFVNKIDDDTSTVMMMTSTPEVDVDFASLTHGQDFCSAR